MIITMTRTGGFAGIRREVSVDTDHLSADAGHALAALLAAAEKQRPPRLTKPDSFSYTLRVDGRPAVALPDAAASRDLFAMIDDAASLAAPAT